jgi:hypothetical protein
MTTIRRPGRALGAGAALLLLVTSQAVPAAAQTAAGQGVGTYTCAEALRDSRRDHNVELLYFSWAQGWMTGWNLAQMNANQRSANLNARPLADQRAFIATYCGLHPEGLYMDAVHQLYESIRSTNQ